MKGSLRRAVLDPATASENA